MTFIAIARIYGADVGAAESKGSTMAKCPCHNDNEASLCISHRNGRTLIHDFAGCDTKDILEAKGLTFADLYDEPFNANDWRTRFLNSLKGWTSGPTSHFMPDSLEIKDIYDYCDQDGVYKYSKARIEGVLKDSGKRDKKMIYLQIDYATGKYKTGKKELRPILYNLPALVNADPGETIYYPEGEKDVLKLGEYGYIAVTAGGTNDWKHNFSKYFKGRDVVLLPDNDEPGQRLAKSMRMDLRPVVRSLKVVTVSKLDKGDVTDYLTKEGGTIESFQELVAAADYITIPGQAEELPAVTESGEISLKQTERGTTKSCLENYVDILDKDEGLSGKIRCNALLGRTTIEGVPWNCTPHPINDNDHNNIRLYISDRYEISNDKDIDQAIDIVAKRNNYHPVVDLLESLKWDGVPRLASLFPRYLGAERSELTTEITTLLFHGIIQRVFNPGCKFDYCAILADKKQGTGKSTICRIIALNDEWFTDNLGDLSDNEKAFESIIGHVVVELGELIATRRTKDIEAIKAFISRLVDNYRTRYNKYSAPYPRQCVFIGTTNKIQSLPDDKTGNRRFLILFCDGNKAECHPLDNEAETREYVRQCYAEAMEIGKRDGWKLVLDKRFNEEIESIRERATPEDSNVGIIQKWLDDHKNKDIVCSRMIYDYAICSAVHSDLNNHLPTKYELNDISDIMNTCITGWERYDNGSGDSRYRFDEYGQQRAWIREGKSIIPPEFAKTEN